MAHDIAAVGRQFRIEGTLVSAESYRTGHINDTYLARYDHAGSVRGYIHQRINHHVFKDPAALMQNIQRVTDHLRKKLLAAGATDADRRTLTLVPTRDGQSCWHNANGDFWRTYLFIDQAQTYDTVQSADQAYQAARAFGQFQQLLSDLPAPRLADTIPDFHNTPKRFAALRQAIENDRSNRAESARAEIAFALQQEPMVNVLVDLQAKGEIPERITHNDTKFNNVMLDDATGEGICVIDLDTVMPGLALYDFGDMVRSTTSPAAEDERDLSKVRMQMRMFEALARGFLDGCGDVLNPTEIQYLAFAGKLITFEIGTRFLADHLNGDVYFKIHRPGHNLDRCRTQFRLVESITTQQDQMAKLVQSLRA